MLSRFPAFDGVPDAYAEATGNTLGGQFSMDRTFEHGVATIGFEYHMFGAAMGTALLQGSDGSDANYREATMAKEHSESKQAN